MKILKIIIKYRRILKKNKNKSQAALAGPFLETPPTGALG